MRFTLFLSCLDLLLLFFSLFLNNIFFLYINRVAGILFSPFVFHHIGVRSFQFMMCDVPVKRQTFDGIRAIPRDKLKPTHSIQTQRSKIEMTTKRMNEKIEDGNRESVKMIGRRKEMSSNNETKTKSECGGKNYNKRCISFCSHKRDF